MEFLYGGVVVPGSPFYVRAYDLCRIKVSDLCDGVVGQETSFKSAYTIAFSSFLHFLSVIISQTVAALYSITLWLRTLSTCEI